LLAHPLVVSYPAATGILDDLVAGLPGVLPPLG
jgi:hypothetical protein